MWSSFLISRLSTDDNCRLFDYKKLKSKVLNLHALRFIPPEAQDSYEKNMASRKHVVDLMYKRFDADGNGQVDSSELSQVKNLNLKTGPWAPLSSFYDF